MTMATLTHGSRSTFVNKGCRCDECYAAERKYQSEYHNRNREKIAAKSAAWRRSNPDYETRRYATDPDFKYRKTAIKISRKLRMVQKDHGCVDSTALQKVIEFYEGACVYYGAPYQSIDHFEPIFTTGIHCVSNLRTACTSCNSAKCYKSPDEWKEYFGRPFSSDVAECVPCELGVVK